VSLAPSGTDFIQVSAGLYSSVAIRTDGSLVSWPIEQGLDTPTGTGFTQVTSGVLVSAALSADGSIAVWGDDSLGIVSGAPQGTGFRQVALGGVGALALRADGSIVSWGLGSGAEPTESGFTQISAGRVHSLALRADGSIAAWGADTSGSVSETPIETGFVQVAAGSQHSVALRADGSIVSWGGNFATAGTPTGAGFTQIGMTGMADHCLALRSVEPGEAYCYSGDGGDSICPCAGGGLGEGCANSNGMSGATLTGSGFPYITADTFELHVAGVPSGKPSLVLSGSTQPNGGLGNAVGDGRLCVGGQVQRSQIQVTSGNSATFTDFQGSPFGLSSNGAGVSTHYQHWYRDPGNTCTGAGFNFSSAWTVVWQP
jgi:hypothetical protein